MADKNPPTIHPNILSNYRDLFERTYHGGAVVTDNELGKLIEEIGVLATIEEQDKAILAEMYKRSRINAESIEVSRRSYADY